MTSSPRLPRIGVGVLVMRDGRVLLGRRRGSHGEGEWAPPGGRLEAGESVEECARRELAEETGLQLQRVVAGPWNEHHFQHTPDGRPLHYVTLFAVATGVAGEPALLEPDRCDGWSWHAWSALPTPLFAPLAAIVGRGSPPPGIANDVPLPHDDQARQAVVREGNPAGGSG